MCLICCDFVKFPEILSSECFHFSITKKVYYWSYPCKLVSLKALWLKLFKIWALVIKTLYLNSKKSVIILSSKKILLEMFEEGYNWEFKEDLRPFNVMKKNEHNTKKSFWKKKCYGWYFYSLMSDLQVIKMHLSLSLSLSIYIYKISNL